MYSPVAFHFRVIFQGLQGEELTDIGFQSISGLEVFINPDGSPHLDIAKAINATLTFSALVLKRAVRDINDSPLTQWIFAWLDGSTKQTLEEVYIELLNEEHQPYMVWGITNVIPRSWKLTELNAEKNEILFEIIELSYTKLKFYPKGIITKPKN